MSELRREIEKRDSLPGLLCFGVEKRDSLPAILCVRVEKRD